MNASGIALKIASLVFAGTAFLVLFKRIKVLKKYGIVSILYVILVSILLALPTLVNRFELNTSQILILVSAQVFILVLGILHLRMVPSTLPWYKSQPFNLQILFILCILLMAYFFSNLSFSLPNSPRSQIVWYLSLLWFVIPILLNQTAEELLKVPQKIFKQWYYPAGQNIDDPSDEELENPIVISFIFPKNESSPEPTTFRAKAPVGMKLGRLFYFFINDYNSRHPEGLISFLDGNREPNGWTFMKVRNKFFKTTEGLDPELSIYANNIRENDVLVCNRIENSTKNNQP